jgi:hypothetical protein
VSAFFRVISTVAVAFAYFSGILAHLSLARQG